MTSYPHVVQLVSVAIDDLGGGFVLAVLGHYDREQLWVRAVSEELIQTACDSDTVARKHQHRDCRTRVSQQVLGLEHTHVLDTLTVTMLFIATRTC